MIKQMIKRKKRLSPAKPTGLTLRLDLDCPPACTRPHLSHIFLKFFFPDYLLTLEKKTWQAQHPVMETETTPQAITTAQKKLPMAQSTPTRVSSNPDSRLRRWTVGWPTGTSPSLQYQNLPQGGAQAYLQNTWVCTCIRDLLSLIPAPISEDQAPPSEYSSQP